MDDVYTLVSVQGSRAASHGKHFKVSTLFIITRVSSGLKKIADVNLYKYLHVKIASLANVKSCITVGPISLMENVWSCIVPLDHLSGLAL